MTGSYTDARDLIDLLADRHRLTHEQWRIVLDGYAEDTADYAAQKARIFQNKYYKNHVYIRGLIEFTNICRNDCYYCGIRKGNQSAPRYRLTKEQILSCCETGYALGFRTFVMQGGEDGYFTDERLCDIISSIKERWPDCALTLSIGERTKSSYRLLFKAGADRFLLRHETYDNGHYSRLHPPALSGEHRKRCLHDLKEIGFQTGTGFMVGSPYQTTDHLAMDLCFLQDFNPHMVGIGPFLPHHATPFAHMPAGSADMTVYILSLIRLMLPKVLLPATTALGTAASDGRKRGMLAGANVVMPNLSPADVRSAYMLYDNKIAVGAEAAESLALLKEQMHEIGYEVVTARGDSLNV